MSNLIRLALAATLTFGVAACGETERDDDNNTKPDAGDTTPDAGDTTPDAGDTTPDAGDTTPDAGEEEPNNPVDTTPNSCGEYTNYGNLELEIEASGTTSAFGFAGELEDGSYIYAELYAGEQGAFKDLEEITTGEFELSGAESSYSTCSICIFLDVYSADGQSLVRSYMPTSGTIKLDSVEGELKGSLKNVVFAQQDEEGEFLEDGCESELGLVTFEGTIEEPQPE